MWWSQKGWNSGWACLIPCKSILEGPGTVHLQVDNKAQPSVKQTPWVPTALREKFKAEVDRITAWVSSVAIATKKLCALRICIEPHPLNWALKHETYQLPILDNLMPELAWAKVFSTIDLIAGYWNCVLDDQSSLLTTFMTTSFGRYRWKWLALGL